MSPTLNVIEAAALMKIHPKTVTDLINTGKIPAAKIGRAYVLMTKDVLHYVEEQIALRMKKQFPSTRVTRVRQPSLNHAG